MPVVRGAVRRGLSGGRRCAAARGRPRQAAGARTSTNGSIPAIAGDRSKRERTRPAHTATSSTSRTSSTTTSTPGARPRAGSARCWAPRSRRRQLDRSLQHRPDRAAAFADDEIELVRTFADQARDRRRQRAPDRGHRAAARAAARDQRRPAARWRASEGSIPSSTPSSRSACRLCAAQFAGLYSWRGTSPARGRPRRLA